MKKLILILIATLFVVSCSTDSINDIIVNSNSKINNEFGRFVNETKSPEIDEAFEILMKDIENSYVARSARVTCHTPYGSDEGSACVTTSNGTIVKVTWKTLLISASNMATEVVYQGTVVSSCQCNSNKGFEYASNEEIIKSADSTYTSERGSVARTISILCHTSYSNDSGNACVLVDDVIVNVKWGPRFLGGHFLYTEFTGTIVSGCECNN